METIKKAINKANFFKKSGTTCRYQLNTLDSKEISQNQKGCLILTDKNSGLKILGKEDNSYEQVKKKAARLAKILEF